MTTLTLGSGPTCDLDELLATRLLVQGSSGSGKTHLLRRLLEASAPAVQQLVVDPEGEFAYLARLFGHTLVDARAYRGDLPLLATQARERRVSCVLDLSACLDPAEAVAAVATWVGALFEAPREAWHPALVVVDEAHLFAGDAVAGEKAARLASASALANLMCRGRKRGLGGCVATQRVSKLNKTVAAEALNVLVGRTLLDIDVRRSATLVGLAPADRDRVRDLARGEFLALGPAVASRTARLVVSALAPGDRSPPTTGATRATPAGAVAAASPPPRLPALLASVLARLGREPYATVAAVAQLPGVSGEAHARGLVGSLVALGLAGEADGVYLAA